MDKLRSGGDKFFVTQFLTGNELFHAYLKKIGKVAAAACPNGTPFPTLPIVRFVSAPDETLNEKTS